MREEYNNAKSRMLDSISQYEATGDIKKLQSAVHICMSMLYYAMSPEMRSETEQLINKINNR